MLKKEKIKNLLTQQVFIIMLGTLLSKFIGLIRDTVLAKYYGANLITDAYIISTLIPSILIGTIANAILSTYIPVLNDEKKHNKGCEFSNNFINICIIIITAIIGIYFIFRKQIVSLFVIGFKEEEINLIIRMTNLTMFASYALVLISIYSGYLQSNNKFIATSFYGLIFNIMSIIGIIIAKDNYNIMAIFFVLGYFISLVILIIDSVRCGYKYQLKLNFKDKSIKNLFLLTLPVLFNSIVWDINVVIDKSLISTAGAGYVSALNYSDKVIGVAINVIATSIAVYIFPKISAMFQQNDENKFNETITNSIILLLILLIPITVFIIYFAEPIIKILFMRGNFDGTAIETTKNSLQLYAISIIPIGINTIIYKVFNSMQKNRIPAVNAVISIIINIMFNLILIKQFSYKGIIIATAISNFIAMILIIIKAIRNNIKIKYKNILLYIIKIAISTAIAFLVVAYVYKIFEISYFIKTIIIGIIYCLIYLGTMLLQNVRFNNLKI